MPLSREIIVSHSSDLHVDDGYTKRVWHGDGNGPLAAVINTALEVGSDLLLLAGDVFEHNRLKADILDRSHALLSDAPMPVVILPGNHDPLTRESVWHRGKFSEIENVHVLGLECDTIGFEPFGLEIWARAHRDYGDLNPLQGAPTRNALRHLIAAHGHYVDELPSGNSARAAWLLTPEAIDATGADYVALGHWNVATDVSTENVAAHYSGSPDYARTINVVTFRNGKPPIIEAASVKGLPV